MAKTIQIKCTGSDQLQYHDLVTFQGDFKKRTEHQLTQIATSIVKYGFTFPFFVWKDGAVNYCMDGHGRLSALYDLAAKGWEVPELPVVYVEAADEREAKQKLLRLNSSYGEIDVEGFIEYIESDNLLLEWDELNIKGISREGVEGGDIDDFFSEPGKEAPEPKRCPECGGLL